MSKTINLGAVTAYADAVAAGYTGTREQFAQDLANAANYAAESHANAEAASDAAETATAAASAASLDADAAHDDAASAHADAEAALSFKTAAETAAGTATTKAGEAANSASQAATSASGAAGSATAASGSATAAAGSATNAAASETAAAGSATAAAGSASAAAQTLVDVNAAGATQVAAIAAKGEEVLESIPADYTTLSNDVDDLKSDLGNLANLETEDKSNLVAAINEAANSGSGITEELKLALLQLASKVAYIDEDGQDYYNDLYNAFYPPANLDHITAVYTQSGTVYDTDTLDDLRAGLVVTAYYSNSSSTILTSYMLSGTLETGTSTVTVLYGGKTATFTVTVTHDDSGDWDYIWKYEDGLPPASDWSWHTSGGSGQIHSIVDDGMKMAAKSGTQAWYNFDYGASSVLEAGGCIVECEFYVPSANVSNLVNACFLELAASNGTNGLHVCMAHPKGQNGALYVKLFNNSDLYSGTTLSNWAYDTPYVLRLEVDCEHMLGQVYLNGTLIGDNIDLSTVQYATNVIMFARGVTVDNAAAGSVIQSFKIKYGISES